MGETKAFGSMNNTKILLELLLLSILYNYLLFIPKDVHCFYHLLPFFLLLPEAVVIPGSLFTTCNVVDKYNKL